MSGILQADSIANSSFYYQKKQKTPFGAKNQELKMEYMCRGVWEIDNANAAERRTQRTRQEIAPGGRTVDNKWRKTTKQHLTMWRREEWGWGNYTWEARDGGASELRPFTGRLSPGAARCVEPSPLCTGACAGGAIQAPWGSCSWRSVPQRVSDNFENIDIKLNLVSKTEPRIKLLMNNYRHFCWRCT